MAKWKRLSRLVAPLAIHRPPLVLTSHSADWFIVCFQEQDFRATLDESAQIERNYKGLFDLTIVNDNFDETFNKLRKAIETLSAQPQWVPVSWVY